MALRPLIQRLALAAILLATLIALAPTGARAQDARLVWSAVPGLSSDITLQDVFMLDASNAWAVGHNREQTRGYVYRLALERGRWAISEDIAFDQPLYAVTAPSSSSLLVVGDNGLIAWRDARGRWSFQGPNTPGLRLRDVVLFDMNTGWAFGSRDENGRSKAVALRYTNGSWAEASVEAPLDSFINAAHFAPGAGRAVGSHVWRLEGNSWRVERGPSFCGSAPCTNLTLEGVRMLDAENAWTVGTVIGGCAICQSKGVIGARDRGGWMNSFPAAPAVESIAPNGAGYDSNSLNDVYFLDSANGMAVGHRRYTLPDGSYTADAFVLRTAPTWVYELLLPRTNAVPLSVFMADPTRALVVGQEGMVLSYGYGQQGGQTPPAGNPSQPVPNPNQPGVAFFPETGHTLRGTFLRYWQQNGGLTRFGYPLTEEFAEVNSTDGRTYTVQYFERARFEYHPELAGTQYEVLLGLLGHWVTEDRKDEVEFWPVGPSERPGAIYFPETRHNMAPEFVEYWRRNGGLAIYGYPISEPFFEVNAADGRQYLVQYFERNRFEYHPELAGTQYEVLLGLLGSEYLKAKGWQ
jgi:hypothetical protein